MYKSDESIAEEFTGFTITRITVSSVEESYAAGIIEVMFPNAEEHVAGGCSEVCDRWSRYQDGKIAFDNWYPEEVYFMMCAAIRNELLKGEKCN